MNIILTDQTCSDDFSVNDNDTGALVGGLVQANFTVAIYDPDGLNRADSTGGDLIDWDLVEKYAGSGYYELTFTPDKLGTWLVSIIHATYFPWGKSETYVVVASSFYTGGGSTDVLSAIEELLVFILGLY